MEIREFIENTIYKLDDEDFAKLKKRLIGEYISFTFIDEESISKEIFAEKMYDYFVVLTVNTKGRFEAFLHIFLNNWNTLLEKKIATVASTKKGEEPAAVPRARKYFDHIAKIEKSRNVTLEQLVEYIRIAMSLYASAIEQGIAIKDFEYDFSDIVLDKEIESMKEERSSGFMGKKTMFDLTDLYSNDTATFIMTMILYYHISSNEYMGEY